MGGSFDPTDRSRQSGTLALLREGQDLPFFCVHGTWGNILGLTALARRLRCGRPFYGIQAVGADGREEPLRSIEAMAARYLDEVRARQPRGPYLLGGLCFGGVVAYEMAQQLIASGEEIGLLVALDTVLPPGTRDRSFVSGAIDRLGRLDFDRLRTFVARRAKAEVALWRNRFWGPSQLRHSSAVARANETARDGYCAKPFPGAITLIRMAAHGPGPAFERQWAALAGGGLDVRVLSGGHFDILGESVDELADCLDELLGRAPSARRAS